MASFSGHGVYSVDLTVLTRAYDVLRTMSGHSHRRKVRVYIRVISFHVSDVSSTKCTINCFLFFLQSYDNSHVFLTIIINSFV